MTIPPYVTIEGNIGAGKSTLAGLLAERTGARLILEEFSDNPFLPLFYREPDRYAFSVELFFMAERHKQMQEAFGHPELFRSQTVTDYLFIKSLLFARNSLGEQEFKLYRRLYSTLDLHFPRPDLVVYLHRPIAALQGNIARRGRSYEAEIPDSYLQSVQTAYFDYFRTQREYPVLVLELGEADFTADADLLAGMVAAMGGCYPPGLHTLALRELTPGARLR